MASTNNLPVSGLNYDQIRQNFVNFMKGNPAYKDFNFNGAGISQIVNLMAYNQHMGTFYTKMLMDESFTDSAHTRPAMLSGAKRTGYVPGSMRCSQNQVTLTVAVPVANDPISQNVVIPAGSSLKSTNSTQDQRVFNLIDDVVLDQRSTGFDAQNNAVVFYTGEAPVTVYEGQFTSYKFTVANSTDNQKFVIPDLNIDTDTLRVSVTLGNLTDVYLSVDDIFNVAPSSLVYYLTTNYDQNYQIFFGQNVFGFQPQNTSVITCNYISTNGASGNGAQNFKFNQLPQGQSLPVGSVVTAVANTDNSYNPAQPVASYGGMDVETIDSIRFTAPHSWRRQNRTVTESDYQSIILEKFRNIDSISVWGGEKNTVRLYGKVCLSIKPKFSDTLTATAKNQISQAIAGKYGVVGSDIVFIDPAFIDVDVTVFGQVNTQLTNDPLSVIQGRIITDLGTYNTDVLNHFNTILSEVNLIKYLMNDEPSITTAYSVKRMHKNFTVLYTSTGTNIITFSNPIIPNTIVSSSIILYAGKPYVIKDDGLGAVWLKDTAGKSPTLQSIGSVDYVNGVVKFVLPQLATVKDYAGSTAVITTYASPQNPDIETSLNNIVRIASTSCILTAQ
jgi:hypothetical protein